MAEEVKDVLLSLLSPALTAGCEITENTMELSRFRYLTVVNCISFLIYLGLAVFDCFSNTQLVLDIQKNGFSHPLLPSNIYWLYIWFILVGSDIFLTIISILIDGISLIGSVCTCLKVERTQEKEGGKKKRHGELLNTLLWIVEFVILLLLVLFAYVQFSCKTSEVRDLTPVMVEVGISATAIFLVSCWRFLFSFIRLVFYARNSTTKDRKRDCNKIYFYFFFILQTLMIIGGIVGLVTSWKYAVMLRNGTEHDSTFGIYRSSSTGRDFQLLKLSDVISPTNNEIVHFEIIPSKSQDQETRDIFCLSKFEYRSQASEVVFNAIEVVPVSPEGNFCDTVRGVRGVSQNNSCFDYYFENSLHYASVDPASGNIERFNDQCLGAKISRQLRVSWDYSTYQFPIDPNYAGLIYPRADSKMNVGSYINRTTFPSGSEPLVVFFPSSSTNVSFSNISNAGQEGLEIRIPSLGNEYCIVRFKYSFDQRAIVYNYRGVANHGRGHCDCDNLNSHCVTKLNQTAAVYGYLTKDFDVVPYTECSDIPYEHIIPHFDSSLPVTCPC